MKNGNGALAKAREIFARQTQFSATVDGPIALTAGLSPDFAPDTNDADARIARYLGGAYGTNWRERARPPKVCSDQALAKRMTDAATTVAGRELLLGRLDERTFAIQDRCNLLTPAAGLSGDGVPNQAARELNKLLLEQRDLDQQRAEAREALRKAKRALREVQNEVLAFERSR